MAQISAEQEKSLALRIAGMAAEHGVPNKFTPGELASADITRIRIGRYLVNTSSSDVPFHSLNLRLAERGLKATAYRRSSWGQAAALSVEAVS